MHHRIRHFIHTSVIKITHLTEYLSTLSWKFLTHSTRKIFPHLTRKYPLEKNTPTPLEKTPTLLIRNITLQPTFSVLSKIQTQHNFSNNRTIKFQISFLPLYLGKSLILSKANIHRQKYRFGI